MTATRPHNRRRLFGAGFSASRSQPRRPTLDQGASGRDRHRKLIPNPIVWFRLSTPEEAVHRSCSWGDRPARSACLHRRWRPIAPTSAVQLCGTVDVGARAWDRALPIDRGAARAPTYRRCSDQTEWFNRISYDTAARTRPPTSSTRVKTACHAPGHALKQLRPQTEVDAVVLEHVVGLRFRRLVQRLGPIEFGLEPRDR